MNSTHSDYVTNFKYRWHVQHMQTLNCQGSDNNVFFNDSITDNMHSLAPIKWDEYYCTSKSKHSSLLVSFLSILLRLCHFFGHDNTCYLLQCGIFLFCFVFVFSASGVFCQICPIRYHVIVCIFFPINILWFKNMTQKQNTKF